MKVIIIITQPITIQFAIRVRKDYTPLNVYLGYVWVVVYVKYITYKGLLLHNTLALDVDTVQEACIQQQGSTLVVFRYPEDPRFSDGIPDSPAQ